MGRSLKFVIDDYGQDRREDGYYSTPDFISEYLAQRLVAINPYGKLVLDPCVGKGEMVKIWKNYNKKVIGFDNIDRNPVACDEFRNQNFLEYCMTNYNGSLLTRKGISPDYIIANPPYNCHEVDYIRDNKKRLSDFYGKAIVLNMYSMFLKSIIDVAPDGCAIGVIVHDSFLTAKGHSELRRYIRDNCAIHEIHLCPTSLFLNQGADVRTCLIVLQKNGRQPKKIVISDRTISTEEFRNRLNIESFDITTYEKIILSGGKDNSEFLIGTPDEIRALFSCERLSDVAPCITGISTGNDKKYLSPMKTNQHSIPFYKNPAKRRFFSQPDAFLISDFEKEERKVKNFMVRNKSYMFKGGISCSSMGVHFGATILPQNGAFGVNPNVIIQDETMKFALLSYLNSDLCFYLVRGVMIRTNMITAGYASRIPVPNLDRKIMLELSELGTLAYEKASKGRVSNEKSKIDSIVFEHFALSPSTIAKVKNFSGNAIKLT